MISQTAEYALRTIVWLASCGEEPRTNSQIADATRIPSGYLAKIMQSLGRAGLVHSRRGPNGGFTLAVSAEDLTPLDVVKAIDPLPRIDHCPLGRADHDPDLCPLHRRLDEAAARTEAALSEVNVAEIVGETPGAGPFD